MNDVLSELYLGENKLTASDGIQLGNIMKHNSSLSLLDVRNNSLQVRYDSQNKSCFTGT